MLDAVQVHIDDLAAMLLAELATPGDLASTFAPRVSLLAADMHLVAGSYAADPDGFRRKVWQKTLEAGLELPCFAHSNLVATFLLRVAMHCLQRAEKMEASTAGEVFDHPQAWVAILWTLLTSFQPPPASSTPEQRVTRSAPLQQGIDNVVRSLAYSAPFVTKGPLLLHQIHPTSPQKAPQQQQQQQQQEHSNSICCLAQSLAALDVQCEKSPII